jgi:hypothetical protein
MQTRGWVAFGAGIFLVIFAAAIWIWVDRLLLANGPADAATAQFAGKLNVAFGLIAVSGILGTINGWIMAHSGKRNSALIVAMVLIFVSALFIAYNASPHG